MIESMTGFGRGSAEVEGVVARVELRTVNNRFCEVSVHMPRNLAEREADIQRLIKARIHRGKVHTRIQLEQPDQANMAVAVNAPLARGYAELLQSLQTAAGLHDAVRLEHLLTFQDVFTTAEKEVPEGAWPAIQGALQAALDALIAMRRQEGQAMHTELVERVNQMAHELVAVEARAPRRVEEGRTRLMERLQELFDDERIDEVRLAMEVAVLADRLDITEECVRLRSHIAVFRDALTLSEPVGRKLNFLTQEMNREVNTIGSKSNDAEIAHRAVQMKEELEKIREQVQNIQ